LRTKKIKKKPGTILPETFVSWCVSRDENHHTFYRLFALNHQMGPCHRNQTVQILKEIIHAYHSDKLVAFNSKS